MCVGFEKEERFSTFKSRSKLGGLIHIYSEFPDNCIEIPLMVTGILSVEVISDQLYRITANTQKSMGKTSLLHLFPHIFNKFLCPYIIKYTESKTFAVS